MVPVASRIVLVYFIHHDRKWVALTTSLPPFSSRRISTSDLVAYFLLILCITHSQSYSIASSTVKMVKHSLVALELHCSNRVFRFQAFEFLHCLPLDNIEQLIAMEPRQLCDAFNVDA